MKENSKVGKLVTEIKTHWKTPAPGKYVPYREYLDIVFGVGNNYAGSKTLEYLTFAASCYLMMYHYKLPYLSFSVISIINMPLGYIWTLIWWFVCDNLGFLPKKTERKLYIVYHDDCCRAWHDIRQFFGFSRPVKPPRSLSQFARGHQLRLGNQDFGHKHTLQRLGRRA